MKNKSLWLLFFLLPVSYAWLGWTSAKMPFIPSKEYIQLLQMVVYPMLCLGLLSFIFCYKFKSTGQTGWQIRMSQLSSNKKKLETDIFSLLAVFLFLYLVVWPLRFYPALFVNDSNQLIMSDKTVVVTEVSKLSKSGVFKFYIEDSKTGELTSFQWIGDQPIKAGHTLRLKGVQNWFGFYVDQIKPHSSTLGH